MFFDISQSLTAWNVAAVVLAEAPLCLERTKSKRNSSEEFASIEMSSTIDLSCHILSLSALKTFKNPFGLIQCFLILKYFSGENKKE